MSVIIISNASGGDGGMVDSVTAGDDSIVIGGTASEPTVETGTLDQIATLHPPVAAVAMNGEKITGLANGTAATDAAAFGQVGVTSVAAGDTSIVVGGTASAPTIETGTLDVIAADHPPAANWSNNSKKITSLANGSGAQDAAAFGQIPTSAGSIGGLLASNNLSDVGSESTALANLGGIPQKITIQTLASAAASITFSSIPGTYNMMRLIIIGASADAVESDRWAVTVNGDTGSHYDNQCSGGNGSTNVTDTGTGTANWRSGVTTMGDLPGTSATAGVAGILDVQIPFYAGTTFQKVGMWRSGCSDGATAATDQSVGNMTLNWRSTAPITSITVAAVSGSNLAAGTSAMLILS
jgi:hypothetical protein